ncbi:MAG: response regulator [Cyanobacteria bacterium SZAS LIN-3]|nr:response regulator [Cyanobacteria bacterium SZAS LIN-3]MBS2008970.1 response regulator [Cyanobacteria bacterium SZAS TMP-1]
MNSRSILVVEDNITSQYILKKLLAKFGYRAQIAASAEEALAAAAYTRYDAILLDLMLPGMDGFECAKRLRQIEKAKDTYTPIIALTAMIDQREACLKAGMDDYLSKPYDIRDLRKMLLRWVFDPFHPNLSVLKEQIS